jgi:L-Ala-D/L-Glu epimerase
MKLAGLDYGFLSIPFKRSFNHASASRDATHSVIVAARTASGAAGFGEGCPRGYVTGETQQSAGRFIAEHRRRWRSSLRGVQAIAAWVGSHRSIIDENPAAWAAVELALLDACGREANQPVERILGLAPLAGIFSYTAVLGDMSPEQFEAQIGRYLSMGFRDFKIKLCAEAQRNLAKVRALRRAGIAPAAVRADANNLWRNADGAIGDLVALEYPFAGIEEPLCVGDFAGMRRVAAALDTRIILDESLLNLKQLQHIDGSETRWIANLRVSKMGGLLRSLEFIEAARARGLGIIVGAHVGECSLLTRAAMTIAARASGLLIGHEGAFGTHLLSGDIVDVPLMFGAGGRFDAGTGLGLRSGSGLTVIQPLPHFSQALTDAA